MRRWSCHRGSGAAVVGCATLVLVLLSSSGLRGAALYSPGPNSQSDTTHKDYALIIGTVWGPDDRPVAGVPIKIQSVTGKKAKWELVSDRQGEFAQRVPVGRHGVSGTKDRLVCLVDRPAQPYAGKDGIVLRVIDAAVGVRGARPNQHELGEGAARRSRLERAGVGSAADTECAGRAVGGNDGSAVRLIWRAVVLVAHPKVQSEAAGYLPIVLEEATVLVLAPVAAIVLARYVRRVEAAGGVVCLLPGGQ